MKAARIFSILFRRARKLDQSKEMTEVMQSLLDIIGANRKDIKLKQCLLPALGELVYFLSWQEEKLGTTVDHWTIPSLVYVVLIRSVGVRSVQFRLKYFFIKGAINVVNNDVNNINVVVFQH
jgi:hypothetical protein